jgi:uroporphyrinogen decarboxylase
VKEMTPRARVRAAIEHQETDRVPVALGGGPYGIVDEVYFKLLELFDLGDPVPPFRKGHNISYLDDRVFERLGIDTRYVWPGDSPSSPKTPTDDPNFFLDGYGQPWKRALPYYYPVEGILSGKDLDDIDKVVQWPDTDDPRWVAGVRERAQDLKENTDYFIIARMVTSHGPYMTAAHLRGTEQFLMDMSLDESFTQTLLAKVTDCIDAFLRNYLQAGGEYIDMIELPGDDYATSKNLIMSPVVFRKFIKPAIQQLVTTIKEFRSDLKIMLHSDGMIQPILDDFIEIGIDVVHPLEPLPVIEHSDIKAEFGDQLAFLGGIDIVHAMPGSREDVIAEVKRRIQALAPGGGYILAPANHIQPDVPPENLVTLYDAARQYGQYPIQGEDIGR